MTEEALKPCWFCDDATATSKVHGGGDERDGYNVTVIIKCKTCAATIFERSKQTDAGWCNEKTALVIERAVRRWNACDMANPAHKAGYEAARNDAAKSGWMLLDYDAFMREKLGASHVNAR